MNQSASANGNYAQLNGVVRCSFNQLAITDAHRCCVGGLRK